MQVGRFLTNPRKANEFKCQQTANDSYYRYIKAMEQIKKLMPLPQTTKKEATLIIKFLTFLKHKLVICISNRKCKKEQKEKKLLCLLQQVNCKGN